MKVPTQLRETDKTTLTWDQLRRALSELDVRDRLLLELDMTNALRPSELFGLRWKCFSEAASSMTVAETVYKGKIRPWGKTQRSLATVHLPKDLASNLRRGKSSRPTRLLKPSSSRIKPGDFWIRTTTASGCSTSWQRTWGCRS